jgi:hypothetical protein
VRPILPQAALNAEMAHIQKLVAAAKRSELLAGYPQGVDEIPLPALVVPHDVAHHHHRCHGRSIDILECVDEDDHVLVVIVHLYVIYAVFPYHSLHLVSPHFVLELLHYLSLLRRRLWSEMSVTTLMAGRERIIGWTGCSGGIGRTGYAGRCDRVV